MRNLKRIMADLYLAENSTVVQAEQFFQTDTEIATKSDSLFHSLQFTAERLLNLSEGASSAETLTRSAKILGSLQLTVPTSTRRWREVQFSYKPIYRAVLALRLLDHTLEHNLITDPTLQGYYKNRQAKNDDCQFRLFVQIPLIIAIFLLDAGLHNPKTADILYGKKIHSLDPLRAMTGDERKDFNQINQTSRFDLAQLGLQPSAYRGNCKNEQLLSEQTQLKQIKFILLLLQQVENGKSMLGSIAKIPQIYSSVVLPGRNRFRYQSLPKVALILKQAAQRQEVDARLVDQLLRITGIFPQGYGIAFLPRQLDLSTQEKYELAIVNQLYPPSPEQPLCRVVTRNLQYRRGGQNCQISVDYNLYFKPARDKLTIMPEQRLREILSKLSADWHPGELRRLVPRYWQPSEFFSHSDQQNLWNQAPRVIN
ncbi:hypothetical protein [Rheinheimera sp. WS51]|uniref:hypothetical protein n=1 Tax=Rheinheimera sp. WS51 TaxID=3425886 RepID=UPI003D8ED9E9